MNYDCIIVGGGVGGLVCAAYLAKAGAKILLCHKFDHLGGTASEFRRGEFLFPAGPLSFSFHRFVKKVLNELDSTNEIKFKRSHFQYKSPHIDTIISYPFHQLTEKLTAFYPKEKKGIEEFFRTMKKLSLKNYIEIERETGKFLSAKERERYKDIPDVETLEFPENLSAYDVAERIIEDENLITLLSNQSFEEGEMSAVLCANMWDMMCEKGIWYPLGGFRSINNSFKKVIEENGGDILLSSEVSKILIKGKRAIGVTLKNGEFIKANFVSSNADYKNTFLKMASGDLPDNKFLNWVKNLQDSGSIFCVYLGIDTDKVDLSPLKADHLFYRANLNSSIPWKHDISSIDFFLNREFEICRWTNKDKDSAPKGKEVIILRTNAPYTFFRRWIGREDRRLAGYYDFKEKMANLFIKAAGTLLKGLENSVEVIECSTPLTYQYWSGSSEGACAGWSWSKDSEMGSKFKVLIKTPIDNLFMVGYQSFSQLFMGGYATAIQSGRLTANEILNNSIS
ncbi:MAG: NAD(P)/FAD-dependent oxidoreductase [Candidatus Schekmanbacteria bacterium]|nr:MAG: NAD(P)/FAD-dependent oxidoreductase [Candidatus Schekmanbacteria bacterium]